MPMANDSTLMEVNLPGVKKVKSGKVREIFDLGEQFLFVATDRISAFDVILPNGIPRKGEVLTQMLYIDIKDSTQAIVPGHIRYLTVRN